MLALLLLVALVLGALVWTVGLARLVAWFLNRDAQQTISAVEADSLVACSEAEVRRA